MLAEDKGYGGPVQLEPEEEQKAEPEKDEKKYIAYSGTGTSLGGTVATGGKVNKETADGKPEIDEEKPATNL